MSNNFDSTQAVLSSITDGQYDSTYSALKAAAVKLGAEDKDYDSEYSVAVALAEVSGNGGSGGGSSDVSVGITMGDLIEEAKGNGKFQRIGVDGSTMIAKYGRLIPYIYLENDSTYQPFKEKTYNPDTGEFVKVLNDDGEEANFTANFNYRTNYESEVGNKYFWKTYGVKDGNWDYDVVENLGIVEGSMMSNQYSYESYGLWFDQYNWGFRRDGEYKPLFEYISTQDMFLSPNKSRGDSEKVLYIDNIDYFDSSNSQLFARFSVIPSDCGFGENLPHKANKFVWKNINPHISFNSGFISDTKESYPQGYYDINELTLMRDREVVNEPIMAYPNIYNSVYTYYFTLNSPLGVHCDCSGIKNNAKISFIYSNLLKSLTLDYSGTDSGFYLYLTLPYNETNLEHFNIEGNEMVKLRTGMYGQANSIAYMFSWLSKLKEVPKFDSSGVEIMDRIFQECFSLERVPMLDCGSIKQAEGIFGYDTLNNLKHLGGFKDLKISIPSGFLDKCPNLTVESLMNVINNLASVSGKTLKFGTTNLNKLTADQIKIATDKGWTLS